MNEPALTAVKLQTSNLSACESFFGTVFGFEVIHRYGGKPGDAFEEIVMTLGGRKGPMLKFIQLCDRSNVATGATIQIAGINVDEAVVAATAAHATVIMEAKDYVDAGVRMAVISTDQGVPVELVQTL
ncbi:hypothetical protein FIM10_12685 [Sphingomonadales bacterium 56]|uniref:hypothetical protein n=1 Tax=unclassified Sphingobium TaxID=2611147 RepID=UPI00191B7669|nr:MULTISPECIES: hypothetical protein [unclassified Sphingobium]MBY2929526.1 hypothetical protein [Sphingomonadales bacterium 56]MBY2958632.1 hypothetical protein [Sphingomonadales bacterium 58]CAD7337466.1 hypothetical protein SPHS8_01566 [Sphingobium sp. S8]CAD7339622.1 hypothetical protein SPHS6_02563 [Sphingobium sp. S6]